MTTVKPAEATLVDNDNARLFTWVKGLEGKANNLVREVGLIKTDSLKKVNDLRKEVKVLSDELLEVKRAHDAMNQKLDLIIKELKRTAGQEEVMVLRKYIDLWNPLTFVTQRDLERMVDAKLAVRGIGTSSPTLGNSTGSRTSSGSMSSSGVSGSGLRQRENVENSDDSDQEEEQVPVSTHKTRRASVSSSSSVAYPSVHSSSHTASHPSSQHSTHQTKDINNTKHSSHTKKR